MYFWAIRLRARAVHGGQPSYHSATAPTPYLPAKIIPAKIL